MVLLLALTSIAMAAAGQLLLKVGAVTVVRSPSDLLLDLVRPHTMIGLLLYFISALLWITVLSRTQLSYAYPLVGLNYVLVVLVSAWILGEQVSAHRWVGVLLIVIGFLLSATS